MTTKTGYRLLSFFDGGYQWNSHVKCVTVFLILKGQENEPSAKEGTFILYTSIVYDTFSSVLPISLLR
jgi:hypothetical protein